ncbi:MAG: hypothetical protein AB8E82_03010 [Aureispira sp.]
MRKLYATWTTVAACCLFSTALVAQRGPSASDGDNVRTKVVRDCEYEVLPGLAEVTSIQVLRPASESALKYDEHEVLFRFTPMEGGDMLEMLQDEDIEFVLRSRAVRVPVGPEYIKQKSIKVGTKYAMNLLQTRNREACLERYTYESKALDNDLFEAYENIIPYTKIAFQQQQQDRERAYRERKAKEADGAVIETADPVETPVTEAENLQEVDYGGLTPEEIANLSEEEMRAFVEKNLRKEIADGNVPNSYNNGINEAALRAEIEAQKRKEYEEQLNAASQENLADNPNNTTATTTTSKNSNAADAIREAKRKAKEAEREARAEEKRKELEELERQRKEQELREKIGREIDAEIQREIEAKQEERRLQAIQDQKAEEQERLRKQKAMERMKSIEQELAQRIINETKRKDCVFNERVSGVIEVIKVSKVKEANISPLKYTEYEVTVNFRPDNYAELSKKDKKQWDENYTFTLDPKGKNANPGAGYIRKYKVFKASKYQGFAETLQSGICNQVMLYAPDLPNDPSKISLK